MARLLRGARQAMSMVQYVMLLAILAICIITALPAAKRAVGGVAERSTAAFDEASTAGATGVGEEAAGIRAEVKASNETP